MTEVPRGQRGAARQFVLVCGAVACAALLPARPAAGQTGGVTFGAALVVASDKVQQAIREAREAGRVVTIEAGIQAQNVITQAQVAYAQSLDRTVAALDDEERRAQRDIDDMVAKVQAGTNQTAQEALARAQTIANTLPLAKTYPQLVTFAPLFAVPAQQTYNVQMRGNFPFAFTDETRPRLQINGREYAASTYDTQALGFDVPVAALGAARPDAIVRANAVVLIPYDASKWYHKLFFQKKVEVARYGLQFAELPPKPGDLVISVPTSTSRIDAEPRTSEVWRFDSHADDIEEVRCTTLSQADQTAGWALERGSIRRDVTRVEEGQEGRDWYDKGLQSANDNTACWRMRTEHHRIGHSGKIEWRIAYTAKRQVQVPGTQDTPVPLTWAASHVLQVPASGWKLTFRRFDGASKEYVNTDLSSGFFTVNANAGSVTVKTFDPLAP